MDQQDPKDLTRKLLSQDETSSFNDETTLFKRQPSVLQPEESKLDQDDQEEEEQKGEEKPMPVAMMLRKPMRIANPKEESPKGGSPKEEDEGSEEDYDVSDSSEADAAEHEAANDNHDEDEAEDNGDEEEYHEEGEEEAEREGRKPDLVKEEGEFYFEEELARREGVVVQSVQRDELLPREGLEQRGEFMQLDNGGAIFSNIASVPKSVAMFKSENIKPKEIDISMVKGKSLKRNNEMQPLIKQEGTTSTLKAAAMLAANPFSIPIKNDEDHLKAKKIKEGEEKIRQAVSQRKTMRYLSYFSYLLITAAVLAIAIEFLMINSTVQMPSSVGSNSDITFTIDNCTLFIVDPTDSSSGPVYVEYQVPTELSVSPATQVSKSVNGNALSVNISNAQDPHYCLIQLFVESSTTALNSLTINCGRCNVTQETSSQLNITGGLNINGEVVHSNFKSIQVGSLSYQSVTGYLQLNNILSSGSSNINMTDEGDIIIQSTTDFIVDATTDTQAFCFSGANFKQINNGTCAYADGNQSLPLQGNATCSLSWAICSESTCKTESVPTFNINSVSGNIYANTIPSPGNPVLASNPIVSGKIYTTGLSFSSEANDSINSFDDLVNGESKGNPFLLLNLGDVASRSSSFQKWVIASAPSYSLMRPWWIGTFSATVLNGYVEEVNGFLLPGFCPYTPDLSTANLLAIQNLINSRITTLDTLVTFVNDRAIPVPAATPQPNSGIFPLIKKGNPFDYWFSLSVASNGKILLENQDYTSRNEILAAVVISLVIAAYVTYLSLSIAFVGINLMYTRLVDFANHLDNYSKLEQSQMQKSLEPPKDDNKKKTENVLASRYSLTNILKNAPSPLAFVDYFTLIIYRQFSSSTVQFYHLLFTKVSANEDVDQELEPTQEMMKGGDAKLLYEKFCFMNHLNEEKLTDPANVAVLKKYGFQIITRNDIHSEVFTKIMITNPDKFAIDPTKQDPKANSLDIYIKENVKLTQFNEDQVEVETFLKLYNDFCDYNRLVPITISPSMMKEKHSIISTVIPQQFIMKIKNSEEDDFRPNYEQTLFQKVRSCWKRGNYPTHNYILDTSKLENHFNLIMKRIEHMTEEQLSQGTLDLILFPGWRVWDALTVLFHMVVGGLVAVPLVLIVILNESEYYPWSVKDPLDLIRAQDIIQDPGQLIVNLYNCFTWNVVFIVLSTALLVISCCDLLLYYAVMDFPQDKSFKRSDNQTQESFWHRLSRRVEWCLVLLALAFYFGYIGLILTWLLLGAFINPTAFLPFASAALTFVTFVVTKYNAFKALSKQGTKAVMAYIEQIFGSYINKVLDKITQSLSKFTTNFSQSKIKALVQSEEFKTVTGKLEDAGIVDAATLNGYTQKLENLDAKTLAADAVAVYKDPSIIAKEAEAIANTLKTKTIQKIQEECAKRGIPPQIVNLLLAIAAKDLTKVKDLLKQVIQAVNTQLKLPQESADILTELICPQGLNHEETVKFITAKIITLIFKSANLDRIQGLTPDVLIGIFNIFKHLEEHNYSLFISDLKALLAQINNIPKEEVNLFLPTLDIISILSKENPDYWEIKDPALNLFSVAENFIEEKDPATKQAISDFQYFIKLLGILFSNNEILKDVVTKKHLQPQDLLKIISYALSSIGVHTGASGNALDKKLLINIMYFSLAIMNQSNDIPRDVYKSIEAKFQAEIPATSKFLAYSSDFANTVFHKPKYFYKKFNKCVDRYGLNTELENFLKIVTCYAMEDFREQYRKISIEKNSYFMAIAKYMKANPKELIGLLDLIYNKKKSKHVATILKVIQGKMDLKQEKLDIIKALMDIFLSDNETVLLNALKFLNLDYGQFLLVGKVVLNPRFISRNQFKALGVTDTNLIDQKDTIYSSTMENFVQWKGEIRKNIGDNLLTSKKTPSQDQNNFAKIEPQINLVKLFLSDWNTMIYSNKSIQSIIATLDNPQNKLKKQLLDDNKSVDYLVTVMAIEQLRLKDGRRISHSTKEGENATMTLASCLTINPEALTAFVKMFVVTNPQTILASFFTFCPDEKAHEDAIRNALTFGFDQMAAIKNLDRFVTSRLPRSLDIFGDTEANIPASLLKKMYNNKADVNISVADLLELVYLKTKPLKLPEDTQDILYSECYTYGLFAKGLLPKDALKSILQIQDEKISGLLNVLTEPNLASKQSALSKLFLTKYHPIKAALAFSGLITGNHFDVVHNPALVNRTSEKIPEKETIKSYLADLFNVYPEVFDLFEIIFERNIPKFIEKSLPILRRISKSTLVNKNLMESLFALSVAEHFNPNTLAAKIDVSPDVIEFFISLSRLSSKSTRKKELKSIADSVPVNKILSKLKIKTPEFISLVKLIFNIFDTDESILDIITYLGLRSSEAKGGKDIINAELFKGLAIVNKPTDPKVDVLRNKVILTNLKVKLTPLLTYLNLNKYKDNAFLISRLASGNFLALEQERYNLGWIFPTNDSNAQRALLNLTMAFSGLLNRNVQKDANLDSEVAGFIEAYYFKNEIISYPEPVYKASSKVPLPNNSLAYAIFLAYQTMDINPKWNQAFAFDKKTYTSITAKIPDLKPEFILAVVLQFTTMSDIMGDFFGLYEWTCKCIEFYKEHTGTVKDKSYAVQYVNQANRIYSYFQDNITFGFKTVREMASAVGITQDENWLRFFKTEDEYNFKVNQSLLYLLTVKLTNDYKTKLASRLRDHIQKKPIEFLDELVSIFMSDGTLLTVIGFKGTTISFNEGYPFKGQLIMKALANSFEVINQKFYGKAKSRIPGYALTDLCMLGTINMMRSTQVLTFQRRLYNLHQITMNIERKLFFDDNFFKMSKYKLLKILGIPLNLGISNIVEWCLTPSIYDDAEFVTNLEKATTEQEKIDVRIKKCDDYVFYNQEGDDEDKEKLYVADLAYYGGSYQEMIEKTEEIFDVKDWDSLNFMLEVDDLFFINPKANNVAHILENEPDQKTLSKCKPQGKNDQIYTSAETVRLIFQGATLKEIPEERLKYKNPDYKPEETKTDKEREKMYHKSLIDVKSGLSYGDLLKKQKEFEKALLNPNMELIQAIIRGNPRAILQGENTIVKDDPDKTSAWLYTALIGLQSATKMKNRERFKIRESLALLQNKLGSETAKLEELLTFLATANPLLSETTNTLEISDNMLDFLLLNIKIKATSKDDDDDAEGVESKLSISEIIPKVIDLDPRDLENFQLIRKIYLLNDLNAWESLINKLRKAIDPKTKTIPNDDHFLFNFVKFLNFSKLRTQVKSGDDKQLITSMKMEAKDLNDYHREIFRDLILKLKIYKYDKRDLALLEEQNSFILMVLENDYYAIFENIIVGSNDVFDFTERGLNDTSSPIQQDSPRKDEPNVDRSNQMIANVLSMFGPSTQNLESREKEIKMLRLFLVLSHGEISQFKSRGDLYKDIVNSTINSMFEIDIFNTANDQNSLQHDLSQLYIGVLAGDLELCINAFATSESIHIGYLLYTLYGCLNISKLLPLGKQFHKQAKIHIEAFLPVIFSKVLSKSFASSCLPLDDQKDTNPSKTCLEKVMKTHLGYNDIAAAPNLFVIKLQELFQDIEESDRTKQSTPLLYYISKAFEKHSDKYLTTGKKYETFVDIFWSMTDGSFLIKLLNTKDFCPNEIHREVLISINRLVISFKEYSSKKKAAQDVITIFNDMIPSINKLGNSAMWNSVLSISSEILSLCLVFLQDGTLDLDKVKIDGLFIVKNLILMMKSKRQQSFIFDILSIMLGVDVPNFDPAKLQGKIVSNLSIQNRVEIFFNKVQAIFFQSQDDQKIFGDWHESLYTLMSKLSTDFRDAIKDPNELRYVLVDVLTILEEFNICDKAIIEGVINLLDGNLEGCTGLICALEPSISRPLASNMINYLQEGMDLLGFDFSSHINPALSPTTQGDGNDDEDWPLMMKKIKAGTASSKDLFRMVDQEGDKSGTINQSEFMTLTNRLGLKLTSHRIKEIFAKIKGNKVQTTASQELNEEEFDKALGYLQEKNLQQALTLLGITPEILTTILIRLTILLILLFIFIFLGIKAFAIGGTFGSIVNSFFPAAGGVALGKEKEGDKGKLDEQNVKEATDKGFDITTSEEL